MSNNINYGEIGFKCGIEIHQQLSTQQKLFCSCPVDLEDENPSYKIERYLRAVSGETGKTDIAAKHEDKKSRKYIYNYYDRNNCLVELDEEPPHEMDREALDTALKFARLVGADIPEEIQIMRKMVIDGSNTSGFQRTAMIGFNGEIETGEGKVKIDDIELEEESAGIHSTDEDKKVFDLNRLGIPLVEVGTDASIKNPKHAREVAKEIGMLLRSTGKARRGIGTIRQDVNISIEKGARVEIKGFQDVENIDKLIENEVKRQKNLVEIGENLPDKSNQIERIEVTEIFRNSDNQIINTVIENDGEVYGIKLPKLKGKMNKDISPNRYLAKELVDYAKNQGVNGLIHSGEDLEKYKLKDKFEKLSEEIEAGENDVIAIIAAEEEKAKNAAEAVENRAKKNISGENTGRNKKCRTKFLNNLP